MKNQTNSDQKNPGAGFQAGPLNLLVTKACDCGKSVVKNLMAVVLVLAIPASYGCSSYKSATAASLGGRTLNADTAYLVKLQYMPRSVYSNDPDDPTPILPVVDTLNSTLARVQMKAYLQSITIEQNQNVLVTNAPRAINQAVKGSNAFGESLVSTIKKPENLSIK